MEFKSSNPAFKGFTKSVSAVGSQQGIMTMNGTINKSMILLFTIIVTASITWRSIFEADNPSLAMGLMMTGLIVGLIFSLVTIFKKEWSMVTAPVYAIFEGLFLGGISAFFEAMYPGIVLKSVMLTFGTFGIMLFAYRTGVIKPTKKFMMGVVGATGAIALIYFVDILLGMFGVNMPMIHSNGIFGIIFSLVVVTIAALNLILDFKFIEDGVNMGAPKFMEWYASFGLMVTLVWLYIEILRLVSILQGRD